jgi:hypothetical protein
LIERRVAGRSRSPRAGIVSGRPRHRRRRARPIRHVGEVSFCSLETRRVYKTGLAYEPSFARRTGLALETRRTCTLDPMQLQSARLCLDCDEVHDGQRCPHCASETFAYITRWVPVPDRPDRVDRSDRPQTRARTPEPSSPETLGAYREMLLPDQQGSGKWKTIRRGAVGLALFGIAGWLWRQNRSGDEPDQTTGDEPSQQQRT